MNKKALKNNEFKNLLLTNKIMNTINRINMIN